MSNTDQRKPSGQSTGSSTMGREGSDSTKTFRCADTGNNNCKWETSGGSDGEIMQKVEQHARESHNMPKLDDQTRSKVQNAIRERPAA